MIKTQKCHRSGYDIVVIKSSLLGGGNLILV
jgi:hypothetical protein